MAVPPADQMKISAKIVRSGSDIWRAETSLSSLNRSLEELVTYLFRCQNFPYGVILSTGTGIVPPMDVALEAGDSVEIAVNGLGILQNPVVVIPETPTSAAEDHTF